MKRCFSLESINKTFICTTILLFLMVGPPFISDLCFVLKNIDIMMYLHGAIVVNFYVMWSLVESCLIINHTIPSFFYIKNVSHSCTQFYNRFYFFQGCGQFISFQKEIFIFFNVAKLQTLLKLMSKAKYK